METVLIGLGGNVGNVAKSFEEAMQDIEMQIGRVTRRSSNYKTEPWGNKDQATFLNKVIAIETTLSAEEVLKEIFDIEKKLGRYRDPDNQFAPRTIDIDILFYGEKIINHNNLIIPHKRLHLRNFVLAPLMEVAPDFNHPVLYKTIKYLFDNSPDQSLAAKE